MDWTAEFTQAIDDAVVQVVTEAAPDAADDRQRVRVLYALANRLRALAFREEERLHAHRHQLRRLAPSAGDDT